MGDGDAVLRRLSAALEGNPLVWGQGGALPRAGAQDLAWKDPTTGEVGRMLS